MTAEPACERASKCGERVPLKAVLVVEEAPLFTSCVEFGRKAARVFVPHDMGGKPMSIPGRKSDFEQVTHATLT